MKIGYIVNNIKKRGAVISFKAIEIFAVCLLSLGFAVSAYAFNDIYKMDISDGVQWYVFPNVPLNGVSYPWGCSGIASPDSVGAVGCRINTIPNPDEQFYPYETGILTSVLDNPYYTDFCFYFGFNLTYPSYPESEYTYCVSRATLENVSPSPLQSTLTRIIATEPISGTTTTGYTATTSAVVYINPLDFEEGMYLQMSFSNQTVNNLGGSALDAYNSAFGIGKDIRIPITITGNPIYLSTSTIFGSAGVTFGNYKIVKPSLLSSLPFIGNLINGNILVATTTTFIVSQKTPLDIAIEQGAIALANALLTGTTTSAVLMCSPLNFDLARCLISLVMPSGEIIGNDMKQIRDGFLSIPPWGYLTRFLTILTNTATTTLPNFSISLPIGQNSTTTISYNMQDTFDGGATLLNSIKDPTSGKNFQQVIEPFMQLLVAVLVIFIMIQSLLSLSK